MRKLIGAAVMAMALLAPSFSQAGGGGSIVQEMREFCKKGHDSYTYCLGMIAGLVYMFAVNQQTDARFKACIPKSGITGGQITQEFLNWADDNPKEWQRDGVWGMATVIRETWPCK